MYGKTYVVGDTHGRGIKFKSEPEDLLIHIGDYEQGDIETDAQKVIILGNHDTLPVDKFDFACDGLLFKGIWFTHEPAERMPKGAKWNVCGHVHYHNMNDCGYEKKWFHIVLPPNQILLLDKVIFDHETRQQEEHKWL